MSLDFFSLNFLIYLLMYNFLKASLFVSATLILPNFSKKKTNSKVQLVYV